ncbi:MAG: hypothetical protein ABJA67_09095, partial [Chthonomonadales bacterium]
WRSQMRYLTVVALLIIASTRANAYIDAGTGSYILQMAMAGILAVGYMLKLFWKRIATYTSQLFKKTAP